MLRIAFIRSVLLYSFPSFCNLLFNKLLRVERLASRYFSDYEFCNLSSAAEAICRRLFANIVKLEDHPLRPLFRSRYTTSRNACSLTAPYAKTIRLASLLFVSDALSSQSLLLFFTMCTDSFCDVSTAPPWINKGIFHFSFHFFFISICSATECHDSNNAIEIPGDWAINSWQWVHNSSTERNLKAMK